MLYFTSKEHPILSALKIENQIVSDCPSDTISDQILVIQIISELVIIGFQ